MSKESKESEESEKGKTSKKERAREYYHKNKAIIKEKAKIRYQNLSEEQKELKRQYSRNRYKKLVESALVSEKYFLFELV